jgi:hypothetical protein
MELPANNRLFALQVMTMTEILRQYKDDSFINIKSEVEVWEKPEYLPRPY